MNENSPVHNETVQYWNQIDAHLHPKLKRVLSVMHQEKTREIEYSTIEAMLMPLFAQVFVDGSREVTEQTDIKQSVAKRYVKAELIQALMSEGGQVRKDFIGDLTHNVNMLYYAKRLL